MVSCDPGDTADVVLEPVGIFMDQNIIVEFIG
jgi:hypothetical protein